MAVEYDLIIVGGGAAGYFTAVNSPDHFKTVILEKNREPLQKVKVSGGGRCNVTNFCFEPELLVKNYPRGEDFLYKPFSNFGPAELIRWFEKRGVRIKNEADGRMFPVTDNSQTIIDCFRIEAKKKDIELRTTTRLQSFEREQNKWKVILDSGEELMTRFLVLTTGSDKSVWNKLQSLGLRIIDPVPSLFTFNIPDNQLHQLSGVSFQKITVSAGNKQMSGPGLITHWGMSGPAVLKLSAWNAIEFAKNEYHFSARIDWIPDLTQSQVTSVLRDMQQTESRKKVLNVAPFNLSKRFWEYICHKAEIREFQNWSETGKKHFQKLTDTLKNSQFDVTGKSTFKDEFVTAGGIDLDEVDYETFQIKKFPGLYAAGEILNIDAVTGGFNFQAAWTSAWHISEDLKRGLI
jgi:predicted Rossmann fold flavoprotein